jgi:cytochrome c553
MVWIRSRPPAASPVALPADDYRIMGRLGLVIGQFKTAVESIDTTVSRIGDDSTHLTGRRGEYLARVVCTECHGIALSGDPMFPTPSLSQAVGYSSDEFMRLLRTGTSRSNTPLTLMAQTAQHRLHLLSDDEIRAIYDYIKALPATGIASGS